MASVDLDSQWKSTFGDTPRPMLYSTQELNDDGFYPLADPSSFLVKPPGMTREQLYVTGLNNQAALKLAQAEYLDLERQIILIKGTTKYKDPQALPPLDVYEEQKEAVLYGYKYSANRPALLGAAVIGNRTGDDVTDREKHDVRLQQEPFEQGGFVPTDKQKKDLEAKIKARPNLDGWTPVIKNGKYYLPRQQIHHNEYNIKYVRSTADDSVEGPPVQITEDKNGSITPHKTIVTRLTRTRFDGKKVPTTRDVSEAPSVSSSKRRADTPINDAGTETPNSKRRRQDDVNRPKHPNQYTKAREAREREARAAAATGAVTPGTPAPRPKHPNQYTKARELREAQEAKEAQEALKAAKPKHPNQYTKAREAREREARELAVQKPRSAAMTPTTQAPIAGQPSGFSWTQFTNQELRDRKWTDAELVDAVKHHHTWLHDDPGKQAEWKEKIINGINPVRSFSMFKKWSYWKDRDLDKRPRGKKDQANATSGATKTPSKPQKPVKPKPKARTDSLQATPSTTPAQEEQSRRELDEAQQGTARRSAMSISMFINHNDDESNGDIRAAPPSSVPSPGPDASMNGDSRDYMDHGRTNEMSSRPSLSTEVSDSLIVINGSPPLRRSMRSSRRSSG
ncbi:hypothetical protein B0A52_02096 [Exophiala mesophila]|uniref:Uncharacterized protein n=1 Tax=Exophiala mesophila TaxID=212818 RepID=A0A438NEZ1_EXOME|nr:hypothetical protein B0A52_02096 [Exophiala mesophila]